MLDKRLKFWQYEGFRRSGDSLAHALVFVNMMRRTMPRMAKPRRAECATFLAYLARLGFAILGIQSETDCHFVAQRLSLATGVPRTQAVSPSAQCLVCQMRNAVSNVIRETLFLICNTLFLGGCAACGLALATLLLTPGTHLS